MARGVQEQDVRVYRYVNAAGNHAYRIEQYRDGHWVSVQVFVTSEAMALDVKDAQEAQDGE